MRLLIKRATIVDPSSSHHVKKVDILIRNDKIEKIGRSIRDSADRTIEADNLHVSPGWCDIGAQVGEPGLEFREDLQSASNAAIAGGFTTLACFPNTNPVLDSKSEIEYILGRSAKLPIDILPIGAITVDAAGEQIAEMHDMHAAGAVAFSDGRNPLGHSGIMMLSLQYIRTFNGLIINRPLDVKLYSGGQMHESVVSTSLGLKGIPNLAEQLLLERDIRLVEYAGSRIHSYGISTSEGVQLLRNAQKQKLDISGSVPSFNLLFTDEDLADFDSNLKVMPPLRDRTNRQALVRAIRDKVITCLVSNHEPLEEERKKLEFARADFGAINLETSFAAANTALRDKVEIEILVGCLSHGPRKVLGIPVPSIKEGARAEMTLFDPDLEWTPGSADFKSKSRNTPLLGKKLIGRSLGVYCKGKLHSAVL